MPSENTNWLLYRRLLTYTARYKKAFGLCCVGFLIFAAMEVSSAHMIKYFIEGLDNRSQTLMIWVPIGIIGVRFLHGLGAFIGNFFLNRVGAGVVNDLRKELFAHQLRLPCPYFDEHDSGKQVSLVLYNIGQVSGAASGALKIAMQDGLTVLGLLSYMIWVDWKLTLVFITLAPILGWLVSIASGYFRRLSRDLQNTMGDITQVTTEALQGYRLVKSYNGETLEEARFNRASDLNTRLGINYGRIAAIQGPIYNLVIAVNLALILFLILLFWQDSTSAAIAYITAAGMIAKPIRSLTTLNETIQRGLVASESLFEVLDTAAETSPPDTPPLVVNQGAIRFEQTGFSYGDKMALDQIDLAIEPGTTVALVGQSGSGKSTLVSLLMRFYEANKGRILIDGQDIREHDITSLRRQIAFVNQQTTLFNDSVAANILYGDKAALQHWQSLTQAVSAPSLEQIAAQLPQLLDAARNANALDFILALPAGFATTIGEAGDRLSGGQRQRLAIARALYKDAPILILDEATSALDNESEKLVQDALDRLQNGRTTLVIAHRLSTVEKADVIVAMQNGRIIEQGTHQSLLAKRGYYAMLHARHFDAQSPDHTPLNTGAA
jgi:ATP-binding cassette, subfamily B, bacterial MsbA